MFLALLIPAVALAALLGGPAATSADAAAWPWGYVSAANGSDAGNDCTDQYAPCATIQHAIEEAGPNPFGAIPSINVAPGTYAEQLIVDTSVTLRGPNPRLDDRGPEAVIEGGDGTAIAPGASNVTITGFTILTNDAGTPIRTMGSDVDRLAISDNVIEGGTSGIWLGAGGDETEIDLNQIEGSEYGIRLGAVDYSEMSIWYNRLKGPAGSTGVFAGPATAIDDFRLEGNTFATSILEASITDGWIQANQINPPAGGVGLQAGLAESYVRENSIQGGGAASCLRLLGGHDGLDPSSRVYVDYNEFAGCKPYAVQLGPEVNSITVTMNTFPGTYDGVVTDDSSPWDVTGGKITVVGNRFVGTEHLGVYNAVGGELDARNNWWGCNDGPGSAGCDEVSSGVDAWPNVYLAAEALKNEESAWIDPVQISTLDPGEQALIRAHLRTGGGAEALNISIITEDPVYFSSPKGELLWDSDFWHNAHAASVFTAGPQPGPAEVFVTMDNERVEVPLAINGKPSAVSTATSPSLPNGRPRVLIRGGTLSLFRRSAVIGRISCAQSACRVDRRSAELKVGQTRFRVRLKVPAEIAAESGGQIRAIFPERAFGQLSRQGTGVLMVTIEATDASGGEASTTRRVKVARGD